MKKSWLILIVLAIVAVIFISYFIFVKEKAIDCGINNDSCIKPSLSACSPSKSIIQVNASTEKPKTVNETVIINDKPITVEVPTERAGPSVDTELEFIVRGIKKENCIISVNIIKGESAGHGFECSIPKQEIQAPEDIEKILFLKSQTYCKIK